MKAKCLLLILGIFYCIGIRAIEREITLYSNTDRWEKWGKDERSISLVPTATIDEHTIRIYLDVTISELQVSIKDSRGNIVYSNNCMESSRNYTFDVRNLFEGEYTIDFKIGEKIYYGNFIIQ